MKRQFAIALILCVLFITTACQGNKLVNTNGNKKVVDEDTELSDQELDETNDIIDDKIDKEVAEKEEKPKKKPKKEKSKTNSKKIAIDEEQLLNDVKITLNDVRVVEGDEYSVPVEEQFIVANITVENISKNKELEIDYNLNYSLRDDDGYSYDYFYRIDGVKAPPKGIVGPDEIVRGEIIFDVPDSDTFQLNIEYYNRDNYDKVNGKWNITKKQISK